jgi:arylsulfatase A-like enzyme
MTLSLDRACGRIVDKLEELGLVENTLVIFTNDNGGPSDKNASSNYPFAGVKATHLEGGIRVPGVIAWPGTLPAGDVYDRPLSTLDLLPTFVAAGGGDPSAIEGLDGVDIVPYLTDSKTGAPHQTLYWKKETRGTIRDGDWKLMRFPDRPAQLFNLADDPAEQNDLAAEHPEVVKSLFKKLFAWELELERPLFQLRQAEEGWAAERFDQFRKPPSVEF